MASVGKIVEDIRWGSYYGVHELRCTLTSDGFFKIRLQKSGPKFQKEFFRRSMLSKRDYRNMIMKQISLDKGLVIDESDT